MNLIADKRRHEHFYLDAHQKIFLAMVDLYQAGHPTDILTVADRLRRLGSDSEYLQPAYLVELTESSPVTQNVEHHARIVRENYYLRRIITACQETAKKAMNYEGEVAGFIEDVEKEFLQISNAQDSKGIARVDDVLNDTITELESRLANDTGMTGVPSYFADLDKITGGWQNS